MGTFGENLRREREMRGVTLEEICDATKISLRTLQAVEADQFEKLPGGIFTRSFVRAYAKYLGLDEEKIMAEFQLVAPASAQQTDLRRVSQQRPVPSQERSYSGLAALLVAVVILAGGFAYYHFAMRARKAPAEAAQPAAASAPRPAAETRQEAPISSGVPENSGAGTPGAAAAVAPAAGPPPAGTAASPSAAPQDGLVLQIAAVEETWVGVSADGKSAFQRTMQANEIETVRAKNSFDVLTGNAQGIILTLNGRTLDPLGRRGETKKVHLTLDGVQSPNP